MRICPSLDIGFDMNLGKISAKFLNRKFDNPTQDYHCVNARSADSERRRNPAYLKAASPTHAPHPMSKKPAMRPTHLLARLGMVFSTKTNTLSTAIQKRFITPATNSRAINTQQHATQQAPFRNPILSAPLVPSRQ